MFFPSFIKKIKEKLNILIENVKKKKRLNINFLRIFSKICTKYTKIVRAGFLVLVFFFVIFSLCFFSS
ncbi:MAG: hypothetical protein XD50_0702 [Clostridia bacterium 41_269]|nr:MAG: hypothetical protein XD50_0702 [Clostridia bacterium 41_269]